MNDQEKIFFMPGDLVTLKQSLPNKPVMLVIKKESYTFRNKEITTLRGIRCRWFTKDGYLQEAVFNTKDLIKI